MYLTRQALAEEPLSIRVHVAADGAQALRLLTEERLGRPTVWEKNLGEITPAGTQDVIGLLNIW